MNRVELTGYFKTVGAYTNGEIKVEDTIEWRQGFGVSETTFYTDDEAWIKVELDDYLFDYVRKEDRMKKHLRITGELRAEVNLGIGTVTNYITVTNIKVLQEEENE